MSNKCFCQGCDGPDCPMRESHALSSRTAHSESNSSTGSHIPASDNQSSGPSWAPQRQVLPPTVLSSHQNAHAEEHSNIHITSRDTHTLFNDQNLGMIPCAAQAASMPMMFINSAIAPTSPGLIPFGLIPPAGQPSVHYGSSTIVPIPLIRYRPPPRRPIFQERFVYFSPNGVGYVNLGSCLSGNIPPGLPTDPLFPGLSNGSHKLALRFTWPIPRAGPRYRPFFKQFDISRGTTAEQLACKIARLMNEFIEANQDHNYGTNDTDAQWRVGPQYGVTINQILLVVAKQITKGSIEPILKLQRSLPHI
ncbi:uncharacterized protein LAESUDRAFT_751419 [Laetiporus sulphureus 93-53]|uniref:Uncharacterized protein n=1 Tax=Laetiporus sulphureus 93-53 TaxID=1314785 RepID=A0A165CYN2_9APHY|nr:uncharacterized protein LAESUDRAFT_751419 [Laetiporus sulphureus 93-53]KZT03761.1 hypothetical protein LAESUDRAFT_751419 [Laetiporus sulphureus 93-53]